MTAPGDHPVFTTKGDARRQVRLLREALGEEDDGFHKIIHVARADMTVVFVTDRDSPLARRLREVGGWAEPRE